MTPEDHALCLCTRQEFLPAHQEGLEQLCREASIDWNRLAARAEKHGVLPIAAANLRRCNVEIPAPVAGRLELAILENAALKSRDADRLATGLAWLRAVELDAMLLKGTALDLLVYDEPWVAFSRDIDLSLRPGPGWEMGKGREKEIRRALYTHGVECDLDGHHDLTLNGVLPLDFARIWREARPVSFRGEPAWVMSREDLLISLAVNACRKRFFRLKSLFDLAETLQRGGPFDPARLAALAREGRCEGVVYAALTAARDLLGVSLLAGMLEALGLARPRARLLRDLIAAFRRFGSFAERSSRRFGLALVVASLRLPEAGRFFLYRFTRRPGERATPISLPEGRPPTDEHGPPRTTTDFQDASVPVRVRP
jgi:putative nucleotidyltransferase-like protein